MYSEIPDIGISYHRSEKDVSAKNVKLDFLISVTLQNRIVCFDIYDSRLQSPNLEYVQLHRFDKQQ